MTTQILLRKPEGKTLELDRNLSTPEPALRSLVAFASSSVESMSQRILDFIAAGEGRSTAEIAAHAGISTRAVQLRLATLEARRDVVAVGSGPRDPRRRWHARGAS